MLLRRSWGLLEQGLAEASARELAQALSQGGSEFVAVPQSLVEELPQAREAAAMRLSPEVLWLGAAEPSEKLDWGRIRLLAAAGLKEKRVQKFEAGGPGISQKLLSLGLSLGTGLPLGGLKGLRPEAEKVIESSDWVFFLDILEGGPNPRRWRVAAERFDYSILKGRMAYTALSNFKILLADLSGRAPRACLSRGSSVLLEGRPLREMGYESLADCEREARWLLTLMTIRPG